MINDDVDRCVLVAANDGELPTVDCHILHVREHRHVEIMIDSTRQRITCIFLAIPALLFHLQNIGNIDT